MIRIITAIDIDTDNEFQAYTILRKKLDHFFEKESPLLGYETTDDWYHEDGRKVPENLIESIGLDYDGAEKWIKEQTKP